MTLIDLTISAKVTDEDALYRKALSVATRDCGMTVSEADEVLRPDYETDVGACFQMILDPNRPPEGTEIVWTEFHLSED